MTRIALLTSAHPGGDLPRAWSRALDRWGGPVWLGLTLLGGAIGLFYIWSLGEGRPVDARAYYDASLNDLYARPLSMDPGGAYLYSPAFRQVLEPLAMLGWPTFLLVLRLGAVGALMIMAGPLTGPLLFLPPIASEINAGNIHLFLALAVVAGLRWPGAWAFVLLTKVTPGVGLLWFASRREWRRLGMAIVVTLTIVGISFALSPSAWVEWMGVLAANTGRDVGRLPIEMPLGLRVALAGMMVVIAARRGWPSVVPLTATLALPIIWFHSLAMAVGVLPFLVGPLRSRLRPREPRRHDESTSG